VYGNCNEGAAPDACAHTVKTKAAGVDRAASADESGEAKNSTTEPEFGTSRRRFLIAMFMCGAVPGERVVERIVADVAEFRS
jgi:hypothetical protein